MMNESAPLMLLDTGYVSIYRFHAVQKWYRLTYKEPAIADEYYDWSLNKIFVKKYEELFVRSIMKMKNRFNVPFENIIFAMDDRKDNIWRLNILSSYKQHKPAKRQVGLLKILQDMRNRIVPELIRQFKVKRIAVEHLEADDIIAVITRIVLQNSMFSQVIIITNDKDFIQLAHPQVTIINLKGQKLVSANFVNAKKELLLHILSGDRSDNISPCVPKAHIKEARHYVENKTKLKNLLNSSRFRNLYERNRTLIDFSYIPLYFKKKVQRLFIDMLLPKRYHASSEL